MSKPGATALAGRGGPGGPGGPVLGASVGDVAFNGILSGGGCR